jgi:hypothetical protein
MSRFPLTMVYALVVVPAGLVARLLRDPMRRSVKRGRRSYWEKPAG